MGRSRAPVAALALAVAAVVACVPPPAPDPGSTTSSTTTSSTAPPGPGEPAIGAFTASRSSGPAPLTTAFTWSVSGPMPLTCGIDLDDDGTPEITVGACTSTSVRATTFTTPGTHVVRLLVSHGSAAATSAPITITVGPPLADAYAITVRFSGTPTPSQQDTFTWAAARWSEVVRTGLPDVPLTFGANLCGTGAPAFSGTVDDLLIDATITPIDGPGGVLGEAGPCLVRSSGGLPVYGVMRFDAADVAALEASGRFADVVLHEMGHVMGFGTLWQHLLTGVGTSDPRFLGIAARGTWDALVGGSGLSVPVEATGGAGTANAHWRESVFDNELMTGFLNTGANPLSAVTIGALADLGYGVDLAAADPFGSPALRSMGEPPLHLHTELVYPVGTVG